MNFQEMFMLVGVGATIMVAIKTVCVIFSWVHDVNLAIYGLRDSRDRTITRLNNLENDTHDNKVKLLRLEDDFNNRGHIGVPREILAKKGKK